MGPKRKSEMWTSNNRVLNGGNKKFSGRNPNFDTDETQLLISLWGDPKIQKTLITSHKKYPVICRLAEQLHEYGYQRTTEEINTRIKNLKCFYNRIKKDMEIGLIKEPTWKHFSAMERIMTTPIFSVRPNEIPKPSPRFQMERPIPVSTKRDIREERHRATENKDDGSSDGDDLFTQEMFEAELDCYDSFMDDDEPTNEDKQREDEEEVEDEGPKQDENSNSCVIPKEEPIDIDDEVEDDGRDVEDASDIFPKLSAYLQLASNHQSTASTTKPANNQIITTIAGTTTNPSEANTSLANAIKMGQSMVFTQQQSPQGKISLVPTNFLLKTQQPQIQLRQQPQHIIYNPGMTGNQSITTSAAGQMPNGMKVLLVNALQKGPVTAAANTPTDMQTKLITSNAIKASCITSSVPTTAEPRASSVESNKVKANASASSFRSLVSQLIEVQNQNLAVSRQRLEVERQRFDFEKSIAERIFAALPNIFLPQNDLTTMPLLKPKIEKED